MSDELRLSVSKTKCFSDCQKKFYFTYVLKLPRKDHDYFVFGKFLHKVLEDFHKNIIDGCKDLNNKIMSSVYKTAMIEYGPKMTTEAKKEAYSIIKSYLKNISSNRLTTCVKEVETNFNFNISDNVILNGMIDRIQIDDDGMLHVADYKSTKNKKYLQDDWFQLMTYGFVLLDKDPNIKKIRGSYVLLRHNFEYITKEFSADELLSVKQKYLDYAEKISNEKEFKANPTKLCSWCDFLDTCEEGKALVRPVAKYGVQEW